MFLFSYTKLYKPKFALSYMEITKTEIIERNPQLKQDINLFKIILMPLELFVLKYLLINLRPTNIREVYTNAISICFFSLFSPEDLEDPKEKYKFLHSSVLSAGYGYGLIQDNERKKVIKEYLKKSEGSSETKITNFWLKQIQNHNSKTPSYDKIKGIFNNFEKLNIIYKRGKEGKGIVYALNPAFYNQFKDRIKEIIAL